jgi:hypothetical protein
MSGGRVPVASFAIGSTRCCDGPRVSRLAEPRVSVSAIGVTDDERGFLIASDWHLRRRVLHLTFAGFENFVRAVVDDRVAMMSDQWDPDTDKVTSERLGPKELRKAP